MLLDDLRAATRDLLDPSWRAGSEHARLVTRGPLGEDDYRIGIIIIRELAEHSTVPAAGWRWWADLLTWPDSKGDAVLIGNTRMSFPFSILARDAQVPTSSLHAARLTPAEASRVAAIMTDARDRVYAPLFAICVPMARDFAMVAEAVGERFPQDQLASMRSDREACERASAPLVVAAREGPAEPDTAAETAGEAYTARVLQPMLRCKACGNLWRPRVPQPRKCPLCQARFVWAADTL